MTFAVTIKHAALDPSPLRHNRQISKPRSFIAASPRALIGVFGTTACINRSFRNQQHGDVLWASFREPFDVTQTFSISLPLASHQSSMTTKPTLGKALTASTMASMARSNLPPKFMAWNLNFPPTKDDRTVVKTVRHRACRPTPTEPVGQIQSCLLQREGRGCSARTSFHCEVNSVTFKREIVAVHAGSCCQ